MKSYDLSGGGCVFVYDEGIRLRFEAWCGMKNDGGVYRLFAVSGENTALIGVMMPERGKLRLGRYMSKSELLRLGVGEIDGFFVSGGEIDGRWHRTENAGRFFDDRDIAKSCAAVSDALYMKSGGIISVAFRIKADEPFPMMPVFCFGETKIINGEEYVIFRLKNGRFSE